MSTQSNDPSPSNAKGGATVTQLAASNLNSQSSNDDAMRQAILAVVQIWLNRLSLVSGITTFFASIDSLLFSLASGATSHIGDRNVADWTSVDQLVVVSFAGALIFHIFSAIVAFLGSFVLVRLQLIDADQQETRAEGKNFIADAEKMAHRRRTSSVGFPTPVPTLAPVEAWLTSTWSDAYNDVYGRVSVSCTPACCYLSRRIQRGAAPGNPPDSILDPPIQVLERCHTLSVLMALLGFILALMGILAYAWVATPLSVSVFSTACLGVCLLSGVVVMW